MKKRIAFVLSILIAVVTVISPACTVNVQAKESIAQIVSDMPLEQKVAQMIMPSFRYWGTGDSENAYRAANVIGKELAVQGINVDFAPVMDVNNNPENPIIGVCSFSDNPYTVARFGQRFIGGLHSNGVMTALKHFPGHGDTATDSHTGLPLIDKTYDELKKLELIPYAAVAKKSDFVMTAHIQYPKN